MKLLFTTISFALLSFSTFAAAVCPGGFETVKVCKSAPAANDHEVAVELLDTIVVCEKGRQTKLVLSKRSESEALKAKVISRTGATTYEMDSNDVTLTLVTVPGKKAKFSMILKASDLKLSSTFSCK